MQYLLQKAKSYDFAGQTAVIKTDNIKCQAFFTSILRWQNDQGNRLRQEFTVYQILANGKVKTNPVVFGEWLKKPALSGKIISDSERNAELFKKVELAADKRLGQLSNQYLQPENHQWVSAAWIET